MTYQATQAHFLRNNILFLFTALGYNVANATVKRSEQGKRAVTVFIKKMCNVSCVLSGSNDMGARSKPSYQSILGTFKSHMQRQVQHTKPLFKWF